MGVTMLTDRAFTVVVGVVVVVWSANFIAGLLPIGYEPDQAIHGIFLMVIGTAMNARRKDKPE